MEHKRNIDIRKTLHVVHMILYVLVTLYLTEKILTDKDIPYYNMAMVNVILFAVLFVVEIVTYFSIAKIKEKYFAWYVLLKIVQLANAYILYFAFEHDVKYGWGNLLIILFASELIYTTKFEEMAYRIWGYVGMAIPFEVLLVFFIVQKRQAKFEDLLREFILGTMIFIIIVFVGEVLAKIWNYFESCILKQNRMVERLNDTNEELKNQQEKINRVNEMLGLQKVQLQAANKKINAAHEESMVQNAIANVLSESFNLRKLMCSLCELVQRKLDVDYVGIVVDTNIQRRANKNAPTRYFAYVSGLGSEFDEWNRHLLKASAPIEFFEKDQGYLENRNRVAQVLGEEGARYLSSVIMFPLINRGSKAGNIMVGSVEEYTFSDNEEFYETIARQISMGVTNAILYQKMKDMAIRDGLTGIYNRRHLTEEVNRYVNEAMKFGHSVSLALIDIDKFKMINDTYGHLFGDAVIRLVAKLLNQKAEEHGGLAGRYGGEEFVLAFPGKTMQETYELVKEVHEAIRSTIMSHDGKEVEVRVSAGISSFPETCNNPNDILTRADWAMYHSKRNGRDQITIDSDNLANKM